MDGDRFPTPAQTFTDAVCASDDLSTVEAAVLLAYARAAKRGGDAAWVTQRRLMRECKIASHETAVRVRRSVVDKGWLKPLDLMIIRGGRIQVYRLVDPAPDTAAVSGGYEPDTAAVSAGPRSDTTIGSGTGRSDTAAVSPSVPDTATVSGSRPPDTVSESSGVEPDTTAVSVGDTKRYDPAADLIRPSSRSDTAAVSRISPQSGPPFRGGPRSGARGSAQARAGAREAATPDGAAPRRDEKASTNGELSPTARDAIASMRSIPGRPSKTKPDVHGTPRTDSGGEHR
jgi:hypothetical protein